MNFLRYISRILIGLIFIYSGFVKGVDPTGSAYKFHDYFATFGMDFLQPLVMFLSIFLSSAEFLIGIALFLGIRMKVASWALLIFMTFFTLLTLILALFNPVSDCGCFGDAIILTNWQTFYKNVVLMAIAIIVFSSRNKYKKQSGSMREWTMLALTLTGFLFLVFYCLNHLPIIDFRPYKVGTDIVKSMQVPPNAPRDSFATHLFYKKNGQVKEFNMQNFPWQDTSWKWVETKAVKVKEGYKPPIHDFNIKSFDGNDITEAVLADRDFSFLLISHDLRNANRKAFDKANKLAKYCITGHCKFYVLTASSQAEAESLKKKQGLMFDFYNTDNTILKTINRANPGLMLIREGLVIAQWHFNDMPLPSEIGDNLAAYMASVKGINTRHLTSWLLLFVLLFTLMTFKYFQLRFSHRT